MYLHFGATSVPVLSNNQHTTTMDVAQQLRMLHIYLRLHTYYKRSVCFVSFVDEQEKSSVMCRRGSLEIDLDLLARCDVKYG